MPAEDRYVSYGGLRRLADDIVGNETVGIGIRPFGFHAGNMTSILAYPVLLCEELTKRGKLPALRFSCFFNDVEQYQVLGHRSNPQQLDYVNIYPRETTLQCTPYRNGGQISLAAHWSPIIEAHVRRVQERFPHVSLTFFTTSQLIELPQFRRCLTLALRFPETIADILENQSGQKVFRPAEYVRAICPVCQTPAPHTKALSEDQVCFTCPHCKIERTGTVSEYHYWIHHCVLTLPKLTVGDGYTLWMMGADHLYGKETPIRSALSQFFDVQAKNYIAVHAPLILSYDGNKMAKSWGNQATVDLDELLNLLRDNEQEQISICALKYQKVE